MAVRSRRFAAVVGSALAGLGIYTVPADRTAIVKDLRVTNFTAVAATIQLALQVDGAGTFITVFEFLNVPAFATVVSKGDFLVLEDADVITAFGPAAVRVVMSGALLFGDPA